MVEVYKKLGQGENQFDYRKVPAIWEDLHLKDDVQKKSYLLCSPYDSPIV